MAHESFYNFWNEYCDSITLSECRKRWDTYNNSLNAGNVTPCNILWERMYIWYDGTCNPCDVDYKSFLTVGSVNEKSISEIWNGASFTHLRNTHLNGNRNMCYPCDRCYQ